MRRTTIATIAATLLLATACSTDASHTSEAASSSASPAPVPAPAPAPPTPPSPAPVPPAPPEPEASPEALELFALGVVLTLGYVPHPHLAGPDGRIAWPRDDDMPQGIGDPPVPEGLGPLSVTARIERLPVSCVEWTRTIVGVDVGQRSADVRIARAIVDRARELHRGFGGSFHREADCAGTDPDSAAYLGNTYQELSEEPCAMPDGRRVRCFLLADFGYPSGAAHDYLVHEQLVFDATTGARLTLADLYAAAGVDLDTGLTITREIVGIVADWDEIRVRQARPTEEGLVFGFSPYEAGPFSEYTRDALIPWELLRATAAT